MKKKVVAMLLAGGQGSRLHALTSKVAKPALPFGGKYRIIDFTLSNCVNSGIDTVGVLTQYQPLELNSYIGSGQPWGLDRYEGGVSILPPYVGADASGTWYKGTANAIYQNIGFIEQYDPEYIVILSGDHIYKMDYRKMIDTHQKKDADCTIAAIEVTRDEASRFGILNTNDDDYVYEFEEKPEVPKNNLASMGVYVFTWNVLRKYLVQDENDNESSNDFGKNIIPKMLEDKQKLCAHRFDGYWKDVGTIDSFWDANMDALSHGRLDLYDTTWPIYARSPSKSPCFVGSDAIVEHSVLTEGCDIEGTVSNSVVFNSVTIEKGATVRYSLLMPGTHIKSGALVEYAIIGERSVLQEMAHVGNTPFGTNGNDWGIATIGPDVVIGRGVEISPNSMIYENLLFMSEREVKEVKNV